MTTITLDAAAGQVSDELLRLGVPAEARVHVSVEIVGDSAPAVPMTAIAKAGLGFEWLAEEPDLYSDADLIKRRAD